MNWPVAIQKRPSCLISRLLIVMYDSVSELIFPVLVTGSSMVVCDSPMVDEPGRVRQGLVPDAGGDA